MPRVALWRRVAPWHGQRCGLVTQPCVGRQLLLTQCGHHLLRSVGKCLTAILVLADLVQCGVQYITVPYSTVQYITVPYSTVQYGTVPYSTVQYG